MFKDVPDTDYEPVGEQTTRVRGWDHDCRRCDGTGVISGPDGRGILCTVCEGVGKRPASRTTFRKRFSWGVR